MIKAGTASGAATTRRGWPRGRELLPALAFLAPALVLLLVFRGVPIAQAFYLSLTKWSGAGEPQFVGFANFAALVNDPTFRTALFNNLAMLLSLPIWVLAPLFIASVIHGGVPAGRFFRLAIFLPAVLSPVIIGSFFNVMLKYDGPINTVLRGVGLESVAAEWLFQSSTALPIVVAIFIWATMGIGVLIYLAALAQVNQELFDAARVDGASWWQAQRRITIPETRRVIEFWAVIVLISSFTAVFPFIYTLTRGGPGYSTYTLDYYVYDKAFFGGAHGYASAVGIVLLAIVGVLALLQVALIRRGEPGGS
jgi:ABC-type sugar transport system permease subunit